MRNTKSTGSFLGMGVLSAVAASLCCITPVISLLAGSSSLVTNISWLEPARPYLVGFTIGSLVLAWYFKWRTEKAAVDDCGCPVKAKGSFLQSKLFLSLVTVLAVVMLSFPLYAKVFYSTPAKQNIVAVENQRLQTAIFTIKGMTCAGCEGHVNSEVSMVKGVMEVNTFYAKGASTVLYDANQATLAQIKAAIATTGYKIVSVKNQ
jgi:mercuric ion transport protein